MKNFLLLFFFFLYFLTGISAQSPLDRQVSLEVNAQPLEKALYLLIDKAGVKLSFNNAILPPGRTVSLSAETRTIREILTLWLQNSEVGFEVVGSQIVLLQKPAAPPPPPRFFTISGHVKDGQTGELVVGATIYDPARQSGAYTNDYGFFSLQVRAGVTKLRTSSLGYRPDTLALEVQRSRSLDILLQPSFLQEIIVNSFPDSTLLSNEFSTLHFNMEQAGKLTSLGGEADLLRLAYTLPGIQTGADGFGGVSVRGGNVDQNLFLLDGVPVYNATHGLGLYSIYNTSAVRSAKVLTGSFPARFGGRLSSVWDVQTKEGNSNQLEGEVELGLSSLQLSLEGPAYGKKGSFFVSGRRALLDFFTEPVTRRLRQKKGAEGFISYYFYDLNCKTNYQLTSKDHLYFSFYKGRDIFLDKYDQYRYFGDTLSAFTDRESLVWGNNIGSLRWNHDFGGRLFSNTTVTYSHYYYRSEDFIDLDLLAGQQRVARDVLFLKYVSEVKDLSAKTDLDYSLNSRHRLRFGAGVTQHAFQPGVITFEVASIIDSIRTDTLGAYLKKPQRSMEIETYLQDEFSLGSFLTVNAGLRAAALATTARTFFSLQPRLLIGILEGEKTSFYASVCRVTQFLHLLSPTNIGLPKDLWVSATERVPPQDSWQFVMGAHKKLSPIVSLNMETYYKKMQNLVYFQGSELETINAVNWQNSVSTGKGRSYGAEALLKVEKSRLAGWLSYTYSKSDRQFGKEVNNGKRFPLRLDRRHNLNLQMLYKISPSWDFSAGFVYATGTAFTFPTQLYELVQPPGGAPTEIKAETKVIEELNGFRLPDYHKLDFSFQHTFRVRAARHRISLGVYNAYLRKNPAYYTIRDDFDEEGVLHRKVIRVRLLPVFPALRYMLSF